LSSDPDHVEILRSGPITWNAWREKNPSIIPDLAGIALKLSERQMGPINGGPINLKSARLQDAFLRFATLSAADLEAADMSGADLMHARFDQANLRAANLSSALLDHADFAGANLTTVNLCGASLRFATLSTADLEAADMSGADLVHARLDRANLTAANLSNAILDHADFAGAKLSRANLSGASLNHAQNLTQAQITESIGNDSTILPSHLKTPEFWLKTRDVHHTSPLTPNSSPTDSAAARTAEKIALSSTAEPGEAVGITASASAGGSAARGTCDSGIEAALLPDPHQLEILRRGPQAWNAWRQQNPSTLPLLMEVTLTLSERQLGPINGGPINLASACLRDAFLRFAALSEADLEAADLSHADLVHARLDRANLTGANLSNAILDHADFADAKLSRVNLSGASLNHAQNLTQAQINESIGNDSTILPPHLKTPEFWLKTRDVPHTSSPWTYSGDLASQDRTSFDISQTVIRKLAWKTGALVCGVVFVVAGVTWHQGTSLDPPGSGANKLLSNAPTPIESEVATERQPGSTPNPPPTDSAPEGTAEQVAPSSTAEPDTVTRPHETKADGEQQALGGVKPSAEAFLSSEQAQSALEKGGEQEEASADGSALRSAGTSVATASPHGTSVDLPADVSMPDPQAPPAADPPAEALAVNPPEPSAASSASPSRDGTVSDLPADASMPDSQVPPAAESPAAARAVNTPEPPATSSVSASPGGTVLDLPADVSMPDPQVHPAAEPSAEALAVNTPEPAASSSLNDTPSPPVATTALPSSVDAETVLPHDAETPPKPVRKPVIQKGGAETPPKPVIQKPPVATAALPSSVDAETVLPHDAETPPKPVRKPVIQKGEVESKPARRRPTKGQSFVDEKAQQRPGSGSIVDLLAGGL
jgi:uncharacterized protein YjbI with pentapeptide repeats